MDEFQLQELLFNICIKINDHILAKEENDDLRFIDHYMFQATSYVISILHDDIMRNVNSYCKSFLYRSLIENIAIINMYMAGDITEDAKELINNYNYIIEFNTYRKYKDVLEGKQFYFDQMRENFSKAKEIYRDALDNINSEEFRRLINSKAPFLGENYSFDKLVQKYCSDLYQYYRVFSVMVHPNDLVLTIDLHQNIDYKFMQSKLYRTMVVAVEKYYSNEKITSNKTLRQEMTIVSSDPLNNAYLNMATEQKKILYGLAKMIEDKYGNNMQSETYSELGNSIESIAIDKTFGFNEIVKSKFKMVIEMIALEYYIASIPHDIDNIYLTQLISKHTRIKLMEIYGIDTTEKWKDAYNCYLKSGDNISFEDFKIKFSSMLGFIPESTSISKLVYTFIDKITEDETFRAHRRMLYDEAQNLSHANGYMIIANSGAFMEYSTVTTFLDSSIEYLLNLFYFQHKLYNETEGEHKIGKALRLFKRVAKQKNKMDFDFKDFKLPYKGNIKF